MSRVMPSTSGEAPCSPGRETACVSSHRWGRAAPLRPPPRRVHLHQRAVRRDDLDALRLGIDDRAQLIFAHTQRRLHALALDHRSQLSGGTEYDSREMLVFLERFTHEKFEHRDDLIPRHHRNTQTRLQTGLQGDAGARKITIQGHVLDPCRFLRFPYTAWQPAATSKRHVEACLSQALKARGISIPC